MLQHVFSVACQSTPVDQFTNAISVQGVIEKIEAATAEAVPVTDPPQAIPCPFNILSLWFNSGTSETKVKQRIRMVAPDGSFSSPGFEAALVVQPRASQRLIGRVPGILFKGNGVYWIEIDMHRKHQWEHVARLPLIVEIKVATAES
jgi:hypothetical protein